MDCAQTSIKAPSEEENTDSSFTASHQLMTMEARYPAKSCGLGFRLQLCRNQHLLSSSSVKSLALGLSCTLSHHLLSQNPREPCRQPNKVRNTYNYFAVVEGCISPLARHLRDEILKVHHTLILCCPKVVKQRTAPRQRVSFPLLCARHQVLNLVHCIQAMVFVESNQRIRQKLLPQIGGIWKMGMANLLEDLLQASFREIERLESQIKCSSTKANCRARSTNSPIVTSKLCGLPSKNSTSSDLTA